MTTIHRTVEIPAGHRLHLDLPLPADIPAGAIAAVTVTIAPPPPAKRSLGFLRDSIRMDADVKDVGGDELLGLFGGRP